MTHSSRQERARKKARAASRAIAICRDISPIFGLISQSCDLKCAEISQNSDPKCGEISQNCDLMLRGVCGYTIGCSEQFSLFSSPSSLKSSATRYASASMLGNDPHAD